MAYTTHGHWYGPGTPDSPPPARARCGGAGLCTKCSTEAASGSGGLDGATLDCRSPEGVTVALIDGIIAAARIIRARDHLAHPAVAEALRDIADDEDVAWLVGHDGGQITTT